MAGEALVEALAEEREEGQAELDFEEALKGGDGVVSLDPDPEATATDEPEEAEESRGAKVWELRKAEVEKLDPATLASQLIKAERAIVHRQQESSRMQTELRELRDLKTALAEVVKKRDEKPEDEIPDFESQPLSHLAKRIESLDEKITAAMEGGKEVAAAKEAEAKAMAENVTAIADFVPELVEQTGLPEEEAHGLYVSAAKYYFESRLTGHQTLNPRAPKGAVMAAALADLKSVSDAADEAGENRAKAVFLEALAAGFDPRQPAGVAGGDNGKPKGGGKARERVAAVKRRADETRDPLMGGGSPGREVRAKDIERLSPQQYDALVEKYGGTAGLHKALGLLKN